MYINLLTFALSSSLWRSTENRTWWQVPLRQLHLLCSINLTFCDRKNIWLPWGSNPGQIWWWVPLRQLHLICSIPQSLCDRKKPFAYLGVEPRADLMMSAFEAVAFAQFNSSVLMRKKKNFCLPWGSNPGQVWRQVPLSQKLWPLSHPCFNRVSGARTTSSSLTPSITFSLCRTPSHCPWRQNSGTRVFPRLPWSKLWSDAALTFWSKLKMLK